MYGYFKEKLHVLFTRGSLTVKHYDSKIASCALVFHLKSSLNIVLKKGSIPQLWEIFAYLQQRL